MASSSDSTASGRGHWVKRSAAMISARRRPVLFFSHAYCHAQVHAQKTFDHQETREKKANARRPISARQALGFCKRQKDMLAIIRSLSQKPMAIS